jgi:TonB family protein
MGKSSLVTHLQVIDSSPADVFDDHAKRALSNWRYKAKRVDGVAVMQENLLIQLDFNLVD